MQEHLRKDREQEKKSSIGIDYYEGLLLSWPFYALQLFYSLVAINIEIYSYQFLQAKGHQFTGPGHLGQGILLISSVLMVILFPLRVWVKIKLWTLIIRFFVGLFNIKDDLEKAIDETTRNSLASNVFFIVPVFWPHYSNSGQSNFYLCWPEKKFGPILHPIPLCSSWPSGHYCGGRYFDNFILFYVTLTLLEFWPLHLKT